MHSLGYIKAREEHAADLEKARKFDELKAAHEEMIRCGNYYKYLQNSDALGMSDKIASAMSEYYKASAAFNALCAEAFGSEA